MKNNFTLIDLPELEELGWIKDTVNLNYWKCDEDYNCILIGFDNKHIYIRFGEWEDENIIRENMEEDLVFADREND